MLKISKKIINLPRTEQTDPKQLDSLILKSYDDILLKLSKNINEITSKSSSTTKKLDSIKIKRIDGLMKQTKTKKEFIAQNLVLVKSFLYGEYRNVCLQAFSNRTALNVTDLKNFDTFSVAINLMINKLPILIKPFTNCSDKYLFITNLLSTNRSKLFQSFDSSVYGFDTITERFSPTKKRNNYLKTCSYRSLELATSSSNSEISKVAISVKKIISELTHQARIGTIFHQILSFVWQIQIEPSNKYFGTIAKHLSGTSDLLEAVNTYSFQTIIRLLSSYTSMPFRIKEGKILFDSDEKSDWFISLPDLLSTLVNGVYFEMNGTLDEISAKVYIHHIINCAADGYVDKLLEFKSKFRKWTKKAVSEAKYLALLKWNDLSPASVDLEFGSKEYFYKSELEDLNKLIDTYPDYYKVWVANNIKTISSLTGTPHEIGTQATLLIRHYILSSHTITCPSIYYKTSPAAALQAAYGTKLNTNIIVPKKKTTVKIAGYDIPVDFHFNQMGEYYTIIGSMIEEIGFEGMDEKIFSELPNLFVDFLTNKSGGVKFNPDDIPKSVQSIESVKLVSSVSQTRIINFLLNSSNFQTTEGIVSMANTKVRCGIRQQIDRRQRVIMIKSNLGQLSEIAHLVCFNKMKDQIPEIALGKQTGNITDAAFQLTESGNKLSLTSSSDVSGMDASVLPFIASFIRRSLLNGYLKHGKRFKQSFSFKDSNLEVTSYDENGLMVDQKWKHVNGLEQLNYFIEGIIENEELLLNDGYFLKETHASKFTFPSGKFFTSGNHTILLICILRLISLKFERKGLVIKARVLGDDIVFNIFGLAKSEVYDELLKTFLTMSSQFNLVVDVDVSRFSGGFLQQHVFCGIYVPLCARSSIFNVEKTETDPRNPIESIYIFMETIHIAINRVYSQENSIPLLHSMWLLIRTKHYIFQDITLDITLDSYGGKMIERFGNSIYITLPLVYVSVSPMNFPPILFNDTNQRMTKLSILTPQGDFMYNYLYQTFKKPFKYQDVENLNLRNLSTQFFLKAIDWDKRAAIGYTLSEHLNKFKRVPILSMERKEQLGHTNLINMRNNLMQYANQTKFRQSVMAKNILEGANIIPPYSLTQEGIHEKKIIDSFTSRLETNDESYLIDLKYLDHIREYKKIPLKEQKKFIVNTNFFSVDELNSLSTPEILKELSDNFENLSNAGLMNLKMPILPSSHQFSNISYILLQTGFPSDKDVISKSLTKIYEEAAFGFDASVAIDFVLSVMKRDYKLKDTAVKFLGLSDNLSSKFSDLVEKIYHSGYSNEYQSVFQFSKYFMTSGDGDLFLSKFKVPVNLMEVVPANNNLYRLLARDFIYAYGLQIGAKKPILISEFILIYQLMVQEQIQQNSQ